jgi:hypothetical protein
MLYNNAKRAIIYLSMQPTHIKKKKKILEIYIHSTVCKEATHDIRTIRKINKYTTTDFTNKLSEELWQNIFENSHLDVNNKFNSFLNSYLQIFYSCFPKTKVHDKQPINKWLTKSIINSRKKKELDLLFRTNNDKILKNYYLKYSKILSKIIRTAKKLYYNNKILHGYNKTKATWMVIKKDVGIKNGKEND